MNQRNVMLTEDLDAFVESQIASGQYANENEVMQAALRTMERHEREYGEKLAALHEALDEGEASGISPGDAFAAVRQELALPPRSA